MSTTSYVQGMELSLEDIDEALAQGSEKGVYLKEARDFLAEGKRGIPYPAVQKKGNSVKTGFESAFKKIADNEKNEYTDEEVEAAKNVSVKVRPNPEGGTWKDAKGNDQANEVVLIIRDDIVRAQKAERQAA